MNRRIITWSVAMLFVLVLSSAALAQPVYLFDWRFEPTTTSFRLDGLGTGLAGIVADEFTDLNLYPASVTDMAGTTLYTNLANLGMWGPDRTIGWDVYQDGTNMLGLVTDLGGFKMGVNYEAYNYNDGDAYVYSKTVASAILGANLGDLRLAGRVARFAFNNSWGYGMDGHTGENFRAEIGARLPFGGSTVDLVAGVEPGESYVEDELNYDGDVYALELKGAFARARFSTPSSLFGKPAIFRVGGEFALAQGTWEYQYPYYQIDESGDVSRQGMSGFVGYEVALGPDTTLGAGVRADSMRWAMDEDSESGFSLSVPVGFEHYLTDKLALRLGAQSFLINRWTGSQYEGFAPLSDIGGSENGTYAIYTSGLGYALSDSIQIDVLNFGNLTKLNNWRISTTIKF